MLDKIREYRQEAFIASIIGVLLIGATFVAVSPASITGEPQARFSTWYGTPSIPDFQDMNSYTSTIGELEIDNSQFGGFSNEGYQVGCFINPKVRLNGQVVDDFDLQGDHPRATTYQAPEEYTWDVDESRPDREYTLSDGTVVEVRYLTAFNFEATTFRGTYYGGNCKGVFNGITVDFPESKVSHSLETPENVKQGSTATAEIVVDNQFSEALSYEGTVEICTPSPEPCETREISSNLDKGVNTIEVNVQTGESGEYQLTEKGRITINTQQYPIRNVHYDSNGDGQQEVISGNTELGFVDTEAEKTFNSVADSDNDGVYDNNDQCPDTGSQGLGVKDNGCPVQDSDNDGVVDSQDEAPDTYGSKTDGTPTLIDTIINFLNIRGLL